MNPTIPASRSRSVSSTFWFCRPSSAATWQTIVVAPQPPFAEKKPNALPAPLVPPPPLKSHTLQIGQLRAVQEQCRKLMDVDVPAQPCAVTRSHTRPALIQIGRAHV